jgi:predicted class III extradiol MEMO1 family dioxygenase
LIAKDNEHYLVLGFTDLRHYKQQEAKLKAAEKKVEDLLYLSLPRVIAKKLISKRNEESTQMISEIKIATILFISIDHFYD